MSAILMDGKAVAERMNEFIREQISVLSTHGIKLRLAVVVVGDNEASQIYVRNKEKACSKVGIESMVIRLPSSCTQKELGDTILELNADASVNGILVQLPLPDGLNENEALACIDPDKDVDGFHVVNSGRLMHGFPKFIPCTPFGIMRLLGEYDIPIEGKHAVVIGRSNIVGKPIAQLLLDKNATVTVCHSHTKDLESFTKEADILIVAAGRPKLITADMVKPGAVVVDVGINRIDGRVVGDVDTAAVSEVAGYITPVPGGVGPMTISSLICNTVFSIM